jgi:dihydrodiol dehydrogenase / D-xylose 1-dehydrogenase (NADP)
MKNTAISGKLKMIYFFKLILLFCNEFFILFQLGSSFHGTESVYVNGVLHEFKLPSTIIPLIYGHGASGLRYQANEVRKCLKANKLESDIMPHKDSLTIATIEDELRKQIGVKYDVD